MKNVISKSLSLVLVGALMAFAAPLTTAFAAHDEMRVSGSKDTDRRKGIERSRRGEAHRDDRRGHRGFERKGKRYGHRNICSPREAIYTAKSFGLRRTEIRRINDRVIVVSGKRHGQRVVLGMERYSRHCDIAFFRSGHRSHHGFQGRHHKPNRGYRF